MSNLEFNMFLVDVITHRLIGSNITSTSPKSFMSNLEFNMFMSKVLVGF